MSASDQPKQPSPFEKLEGFAKKVVKVPKRETDEKQKDYEAKKSCSLYARLAITHPRPNRP